MIAARYLITLKDGPVAGAYTVHRAPLFLRGVVDFYGKKDVLDQLDDLPRPNEKISVYRCVEGSTKENVHIRSSIRGRSGFYTLATYLHVSSVDEDAWWLRDKDAWPAWCIDHWLEPTPPV